jgi:hypothetical protein
MVSEAQNRKGKERCYREDFARRWNVRFAALAPLSQSSGRSSYKFAGRGTVKNDW